MEIRRDIGPYELYRRTEYSKIRIYNSIGYDITDMISYLKVVDKIISDYNKQLDSENYFDISDGKLSGMIKGIELEYLFIPDGVVELKPQAFLHGNFKFVSFPSSMAMIRQNAFGMCEYLEEIRFPDTVAKLDWNMFNGCKNLKKVILPDGIKELPLNTFKDCTLLEKLTLPDTIAHIGAEVFSGCRNLEKINIPRDLNNASEYAFINSSVKTLVFNYNIKEDNKHKMRFNSILDGSNVNCIEISSNVEYIDPNFFKYTRHNIEKIEFDSTEEDLKTFKKNNKQLFKMLDGAVINVSKNLKVHNEGRSEINHIENNVEQER